MVRDRSIVADLTVIPLVSTNLDIHEVLENIKSSRATKLYNLCFLVVKQKDIEDISDKTIRQYVEDLKAQAYNYPELRAAMTPEFDTVLAALACTHAVLKHVMGIHMLSIILLGLIKIRKLLLYIVQWLYWDQTSLLILLKASTC